MPSARKTLSLGTAAVSNRIYACKDVSLVVAWIVWVIVQSLAIGLADCSMFMAPQRQTPGTRVDYRTPLPPCCSLPCCSSSNNRAAAVPPVHCVCTHFDYLLSWLSTLFCLCLMLMRYITRDRLTLRLWCMVGKRAGESMSDAVLERWKHQTAVDKQSLIGAERVSGYTQYSSNWDTRTLLCDVAGGLLQPSARRCIKDVHW